MPALDGTDLLRIAREVHGTAGNVYHVASSGGSDAADGLSWLTPLATLEHAISLAAARSVILMGPGVHAVDVGAGLTIPASVKIRGAGRKVTVLEYGTGLLAGIIPGNNSVIESLTLHVTFDDYALSVSGSTQVTNAAVRDVDIISDNLECVTIVSSAVCTLRFDDCYIQSEFEWALTANAAAHKIAWNRVTTYTPTNGNPTDPKSFKLLNGSVLIGTDCSLLASEASSTGHVFRVEGASVAFMSNCHCFAGEINIASLSGYVSMTNCHFDRSKVTGTGASRLVDVMGIPPGTITAASIASNAITEAKIATPPQTAGRPTGIFGMIRRIFELLSGGNKKTRDRSTGIVTLYGTDGTTVLEQYTQSTTLGVDQETQGV